MEGPSASVHTRRPTCQKRDGSGHTWAGLKIPRDSGQVQGRGQILRSGAGGYEGFWTGAGTVEHPALSGTDHLADRSARSHMEELQNLCNSPRLGRGGPLPACEVARERGRAVENPVGHLRGSGERRDAMANVIPGDPASLIREQNAEVVDDVLAEALHHRLFTEKIVEDLELNPPSRCGLYVEPPTRRSRFRSASSTWGIPIGAGDGRLAVEVSGESALEDRRLLFAKTGDLEQSGRGDRPAKASGAPACGPRRRAATGSRRHDAVTSAGPPARRDRPRPIRSWRSGVLRDPSASARRSRAQRRHLREPVNLFGHRTLVRDELDCDAGQRLLERARRHRVEEPLDFVRRQPGRRRDGAASPSRRADRTPEAASRSLAAPSWRLETSVGVEHAFEPAHREQAELPRCGDRERFPIGSDHSPHARLVARRAIVAREAQGRRLDGEAVGERPAPLGCASRSRRASRSGHELAREAPAAPGSSSIFVATSSSKAIPHVPGSGSSTTASS